MWKRLLYLLDSIELPTKKKRASQFIPGLPSHKNPLPPQPKSHIIEIAFTRGVLPFSLYSRGKPHMITGELKNKIDSLWDIFAAGGLVNPLDVIEQITYLMFIRDLDDSDNLRAREAAMLGLEHKSIFAPEVKIGERTVPGQQLKWSVFHDYPAGQMYNNMQENVFPFIKNLHADKNSAYSKYMDDAIFKLPTPLVLSKVVDSLDGIYAMMNELQSSDVRGDVYEYLLSKIAQSGLNGQFRTPRHIIRMMVELMQPTAEELICDPACGTSGFLVAAGEWLKENRKQEIFFNRERKAHYCIA